MNRHRGNLASHAVRDLLSKTYQSFSSIVVPLETSKDNPLNAVGIKNMPKTDFPIFDFSVYTRPFHAFKLLFKLMAVGDEISNDEALFLFINMTNVVMPSLLDRGLTNILKANNYEPVTGAAIEDWVLSVDAYNGIDLEDLEDFDNLNTPQVTALWGIINCFIGRNLTTDNSTAWLDRRKAAFAQSCGADPSATSYNAGIPSQQFASHTYSAISCRFDLRKFLFLQIRSQSAINTTWSRAAKVTMTYLSGTELNNFLLINRYICVENPILLAWNELEKNAWALISAYKKWEALGEDALYCKFLHTQDKLEEFSRKRLEKLAAVARAIAENDGQTSMQYYKGTTKNDRIQSIVNHALLIVDEYGGAITHVTDSIDKQILVSRNNRELRELLHQGAGVSKPEMNDEFDKNQENMNPAAL